VAEADHYPSLLAQLVAARALPPEPVATDALVDLLAHSAEARQVVTGLAEELCAADINGTLTFVGQAVGPDDPGRPDIVGSNTGGPRLILEAKFDAALTPAQLDATYLNRLPAKQPGVLAYLAPSDRLATLWPKLLEGPAGVTSPPPPNLKDQDRPYLARPIGDGRTLAMVSWATLLSRIDTALVDAHDVAARADLHQLVGLVEWRSRSGWVPVVPGDLPERTGRQLVGLRDAVIRAAAKATGGKFLNGTADNGPGRWISTAGGRSMWVGILFPEWGTYSVSPAWLLVEPSAGTNSSQLHAALEVLGAPGGPGLFPRGQGWAVPLRVPLGAEQGEVADTLGQQMQRVAQLLDTAHVGTADQTAPLGEGTPG
jgi:hypothetical protein